MDRAKRAATLACKTIMKAPRFGFATCGSCLASRSSGLKPTMGNARASRAGERRFQGEIAAGLVQNSWKSVARRLVDRLEHIALSGLAQKPMAKASVANTHLDHLRVAPEGLSRRPRLYVVGEAPGAEEIAQGRPFVGAAGRALREMLDEAGIDPRRVRLTNAIPFRPIAYSKDRKPRNCSPTIEEVGHYGAAVLTDIRRS